MGFARGRGGDACIPLSPRQKSTKVLSQAKCRETRRYFRNPSASSLKGSGNFLLRKFPASPVSPVKRKKPQSACDCGTERNFPRYHPCSREAGAFRALRPLNAGNAAVCGRALAPVLLRREQRRKDLFAGVSRRKSLRGASQRKSSSLWRRAALFFRHLNGIL